MAERPENVQLPQSDGDTADGAERRRRAPGPAVDDEAEAFRRLQQWMRRDQTSPRRLGRRRDYGSEEEDGAGEGRGSSGPPPSWDGSTPWEDYNIRARLWLATTKTKAKARGPLLLKSLSGTPFESFKHLAKDPNWLQSTTGAEELLDEMAKPEHFGEDQQEHMLTAMSRITFHMKRTKNENWRDYLSRWEVAMRKVAEHKIKLPEAYEGFLLINNLQLSDGETKALLNFTKGDITPPSVREWLRKSETRLSAQDLGSDKKVVSSVLWTEHDNKVDQHAELEEEVDEDLETMEPLLADLQDGDQFDETETLDESEAAGILSTMIQAKKKTTYTQALHRKKEKELSRGYGSKGRPPPRAWKGQISGRVTIEELKKKTRCKICDQVGHWHRECPNKKNPAAAATHEQHSLEALPATQEAFFIGHLEEDDQEIMAAERTTSSTEEVPGTSATELQAGGTEGPSGQFLNSESENDPMTRLGDGQIREAYRVHLPGCKLSADDLCFSESLVLLSLS